jgi:DNA-binding SARP family transcriptional activator/tetratricopeptide (TPR) repeat protein
VAELRLLGPLRLCVSGEFIDLGPPKQRAVLAALAVDAGKPVPAPVIVERVWDQAAPPHARDVLYTHLSAIRRTLRNATANDHPAAAVLRRDGGYLLELDPDQVDALRFQRLVQQARSPGSPLGTQAALLRQALDLWCGTALAELPSAWATRVRHAWQQQRLAAATQWAEAELQVGSPAAVVEELFALTAEHPHAEPLVAALMRALHADGRDAEALDQYGAARHRLAEQLGVDPGSELRRVHLAILRGTLPPPGPGPARAALADPNTATAGPGHGTAGPVPAQLPADVPCFTGRARELAYLDRLLEGEPREGAGGGHAAMAICAVCGMAGVGKTALAVHWAHRSSHRFRDGQLYVNLRGYGPDRPLPAAEALAAFLRALGMAGGDIPLGVDERAAAYRSLLAGRRMLVVLDNAASFDQVRPLLPGAPSCAVVVTSRDSLAGLVALHGARRLDLDLLSHAEALALLKSLLDDRVDAEPDAAATLAAQCGRLPLALRVAGELASTRPAAELADLVSELADERRRLDVLDAGGDPHAAVHGVFSWSYKHLPTSAARTFRLLGLHPGPDHDSYAAAALIGTSLDQTRRLLNLLTRGHLIHATRPGRYGMHDLMHAYAAQLARSEDGEDDCRTALTRLLDHYLATAAAAMDTLYPAERRHRPHIPTPDTVAPPVSEPAAARGWLAAERPALLAACAYASRHGWPEHTVRLARTVFRHLDVGGHHPDALAIHTLAHEAAAHLGDRAAEAHALTDIGLVHWRQGRYTWAGEHLRQALARFREAGDRYGEARALSNLGLVHRWQGQYASAIDCHQRALRVYSVTGDRDSQARALDNLGANYRMQGRYRQSAYHHWQALALYRELGYRQGNFDALNNLGVLYRIQGKYAQAAELLEDALAIHDETGRGVGGAEALTDLGDVYRRQGRHKEAADRHREALALFRETADRGGEAKALNGLGETLYATGNPDEAGAQHAAALRLAVETGERYEEARAYSGLAHCHLATADDEQARHHWRQALTLYTDLGVPDADDARDRLTALEQGAYAR